ncbi:Ig-like domain repeat protein [Promicromonospora soli]|uniref:Ig-like domain-containing protein n=1 Tax=Promicromonospora soli TaxID=2035533 RepID=A0A919G4F7_9MICO|nr:Ig-like domain repeat protein [Promicromonospora soli]GHH78052.1 hypothetical protein GCM10017772_40670 [Promicromonospora soli]
MIPARRTALEILIGTALVFSLLVGVAWAFWTTGSAPGGNGAAGAVTVSQGSTPSASATGRTITVDWAATTLSNGEPVNGYVLTRYDADTLTPQTIGSGCEGTVTTTTCVENGVPAGQWRYSVTPVIGTSWRGEESVRSSPVAVAAPALTLSSTTVRPGTSVTGTAAGFLTGETLGYRLDSPTGAELTGSLAGNPTPAQVPASGGGSVAVTVPADTGDGTHTIHAVASPSGDAAETQIVVDGTAPPAPVLTQAPPAVSGDAVSFAFTEAEAEATVECRLDAAAFEPCASFADYAGLSAGSHTFQARATDTVGNTSTTTSHTWTVNLNVPTVTTGFPTMSAYYNDAGFTAGCGTAASGDVCGTAEDDVAVTAVTVSLRQLGTGQYWTGLGFTTGTETWLSATGTESWTYAIAAASLPEGDYTLRARASDGTNLGYDARTFTIDRTEPEAPTLTGEPPNTSGPSATIEFTDAAAFTATAASTAAAVPTARFECRLDAGAWTTCSSPLTYDNLSHGAHTVDVRAVDRAGNTSDVASTTWTVDATAPTAAMTFPTATRLNHAGWAAGCGTPDGDICGTASDVGSGLAGVAVSIRRASTNSYWDGTAFAAPTETWQTTTGTGSWTYPFAGTDFPADGTYTVRWRATDAVGNVTTGGVDVTLDAVAPPAPEIVQAPPDPAGSSARFDFTVAEAGTLDECRLDAGPWAACTGPVDYSGLAGGLHTFAVRATDIAGNVSTAASYTWTVEAGRPSINFGFPSGGRAYNDTTYDAGCDTPAGDVCGTASDDEGAVVGVDVSIRRVGTSTYWNGTDFASGTEVFLPATGTSSWSYAMSGESFPDDGTYRLRARVTDDVGLTAFDTVTITIDRKPPAAPAITSGPTGTSGTNAEFSFTGEDDVDFECRLDAGSWASCNSPTSHASLADGSHTFEVRAVDDAGNAGPPATRTWTVDATAPAIDTTFPTAGGTYNNATYAAGCAVGAGDLCGTASDLAGDVASVEVSLQRDSTGLYLSGGDFGSTSQEWITATGTTSWDHALTATTFPADDTYTLTVRATDTFGNNTTTTTTFTIDRTKPTATGVTTTNAGTAGRLDQGDTFTLTYSESVDSGSIIPGWNGTTTQNVVVRATGTGGAKDKLAIYNATNTTALPLGNLNLKRSDYVSAATTFGLTGTPTTLTVSGTSLTITLGTPSRTTTIAAAPADITWTPGTGATDLAGNSAATTSYTETDGDSDF